MEDGLVRQYDDRSGSADSVLILVVMEDGLVLVAQGCRVITASKGLNPCCNGRWSRTRPYKTILIINKLKNSTKQFFTFLN